MWLHIWIINVVGLQFLTLCYYNPVFVCYKWKSFLEFINHALNWVCTLYCYCLCINLVSKYRHIWHLYFTIIWLDGENTHSLVRYQETLQLVTTQMSVNTCSSQLKWQWHDSCLQFQVRYFKIHMGFLVLPAQMTEHWQRRSAQCNRSVPYKIHQKLSACLQCGALIRMFALLRL